MQLQSYFDPSASTSGTMDVNAADAGTKLKLRNYSPFNLQLTFQEGTTDMIGAWETNVWTLDGYTPQIQWEQLPSLDVQNSPLSLCFVITYEPGERVEGTYPATMSHQTTIGNPQGVQANLATNITDTVKNIGNPAQTPFISSQPSGASQTLVNFYNDGGIEHYVVSNGVNRVVISLFTGNASTPGTMDMYLLNVIGINPTGKLYFVDDSNNKLASLDTSGNLIIKGALTQHGTP